MTADTDDLLSQGELRPVPEIAERVTGQRPTRSTRWRWRIQGVDGGITLEAVPYGGTWMTTEGAFRDFLARRAESLNRRSTARDEASTEASDDEALENAGLI